MPVRVRVVREMDGERAWILFEDGVPHRPLAVLTDGDMRRAVEDYTAQAGAAAPSGARRRLWPAGLALLFLAAVALACLVWWQSREPLKDRFLRVRVGMTAAEARAAMGAWDYKVGDYGVSNPKGPRSQTLREMRWDDGSDWCSVVFGYDDRTVYQLHEGSHAPTDGFFRRLLRRAGLSK